MHTNKTCNVYETILDSDTVQSHLLCFTYTHFHHAKIKLQFCSYTSSFLREDPSCNILKQPFYVCVFQAVERLHSLTPSLRQEWPTPSRRPARRVTWVSAAAIRRSKAFTAGGEAGSGVAALPTSVMASASPKCLWMHEKWNRAPGHSWTSTTTMWDARYGHASGKCASVPSFIQPTLLL